MKKLTLTVSDAPKISIDGHVFEVLVNEVDLLKMLLDAEDRLNALAEKEKPTPREVLNELEYLYGIIDRILGEGAMVTLSGGRSVNMDNYLFWLKELVPSSLESHVEALEARYE